ncbi:hypothetical protein [Micromonospora sp. BQ11]|uniref:hypothetical protein n=1 Tax=Micromonospora sp. BQ11 TaxID=3452212 RepID=UPI003F8B2E47
MVLWAILDVLRTTLTVGRYEDRITIVDHDEPDVVPAWLAYALLDASLPTGMVSALADWTWALGTLVAAAAVAVWLHQARSNAGGLHGVAAGSAPVSWWRVSLLAVLVLHGLGLLHGVLTSDGGAFEGTMLDRRTLAYPLWTSATATAVAAALLGAKVVRRVTAGAGECGGCRRSPT